MRTFTRLLLTAILPAVLMFCMLPQQASPQSRANFWFLNNTGKELHNLYVSPHSQGSWGADVLGRATLPSEMGTLIVFPPHGAACATRISSWSSLTEPLRYTPRASTFASCMLCNSTRTLWRDSKGSGKTGHSD